MKQRNNVARCMNKFNKNVRHKPKKGKGAYKRNSKYRKF